MLFFCCLGRRQPQAQQRRNPIPAVRAKGYSLAKFARLAKFLTMCAASVPAALPMCKAPMLDRRAKRAIA